MPRSATRGVLATVPLGFVFRPALFQDSLFAFALRAFTGALGFPISASCSGTGSVVCCAAGQERIWFLRMKYKCAYRTATLLTPVLGSSRKACGCAS
jgi:hypothetical protein